MIIVIVDVITYNVVIRKFYRKLSNKKFSNIKSVNS